MREPSKLSQSYIVSSASMEDALREARRLASAAVCQEKSGKPCGLCRHCRKAQQGIHPDIRFVERIVDDEGRQKKEILVDQIREPAKVERELWKIIPPEEGNDLCHRFVHHGREVCIA
ncbi:MAG: hypothetical protein IJ364_06210, partial [Oscillospiraceae bacterium]|nr:hypothetical protein [Oscillospiraceae bacterium]